jgi:hypothetical protein
MLDGRLGRRYRVARAVSVTGQGDVVATRKSRPRCSIDAKFGLKAAYHQILDAERLQLRCEGRLIETIRRGFFDDRVPRLGLHARMDRPPFRAPLHRRVSVVTMLQVDHASPSSAGAMGHTSDGLKDLRLAMGAGHDPDLNIDDEQRGGGHDARLHVSPANVVCLIPSSSGLNPHPFDFIQADLIGAPIVELGGAGGGVVGHRGRVLQGASVFEVCRDTGRSEGVITDLGGDAGGGGAAADHGVGVGLGQGRGAQHPPPPLYGPKQRPLGIAAQSAAVQIGVQVGLQGMVAGHFVALAPLLMKPDPEASVLDVNVLDLHPQGGAHACEAEYHQSDQRPVAQAGRRGDVDSIEELPRLCRIEDRRLSPANAMRWPANGGGRIGRHDLAHDQPVEQMADRGQVLLRCWRRLERIELQRSILIEGRHSRVPGRP